MKQLFKNLGADEKETKIFLKLLELGAQPVSVIAKHINIPRSSMYTMLDRLKKLELVEEFMRAGIKYVRCIPVKNLKEVLRNREQEIERTIDLLQEQLPELQRIENTLTITPKVNFFEGKEAVAKMYRKIFQAKSFCSIFNPHSVKKIMPDFFHTIPQELKKNKGTARELLVACPEAQEYKQKYSSAKHRIKILEHGMHFDSDIIITQDTIYMVSYGQNDISALEIINVSLADTQRKIFEKLFLV